MDTKFEPRIFRDYKQYLVFSDGKIYNTKTNLFLNKKYLDEDNNIITNMKQ